VSYICRRVSVGVKDTLSKAKGSDGLDPQGQGQDQGLVPHGDKANDLSFKAKVKIRPKSGPLKCISSYNKVMLQLCKPWILACCKDHFKALTTTRVAQTTSEHPTGRHGDKGTPSRFKRARNGSERAVICRCKRRVTAPQIWNWALPIAQWRLKIDPKFQVEGVTPTNHSSSQKTRLNVLSYGIQIWTDLSTALSQFTRVTDGQTDRQTDGRTEFSSLDRVCIPCSAVKTGENLCSSRVGAHSGLRRQWLPHCRAH